LGVTAAVPLATDLNFAEAVELILQRLPGVSAIYLYGSCARGDARPDSDVDLAVFTAGAPLTPLDLWETRLDLTAMLGWPVDLVHLDVVSTILQREVMVDGVRLHAADPFEADLMELRVLREYDDLKRRRAPLEADIVARGRVFVE
jgi:predicted nucleotidyltransferase